MDGIKITVRKSSALLSKMVASISEGKDLKPLQQAWLLEYIDATFKARSSKSEWYDYTQKDLVAQLKENGVSADRIVDRNATVSRPSYYYRRTASSAPEAYEVTFQHFTVNFGNYTGGSSREGSYHGINAYFFGTYHSVDLRFMTAATAASTLVELDTLIPQWIEAYWPDLLLEAQKQAKMKSINENTIETLVKAKLAGTGVTYAVEKQKLRVKVFFNIGCKLQIEWFLSHKSFMQELDAVIESVLSIKKTAEATGTTFTVKKLDNDINWQ